jgi:hypothetical protein
MSLPEDKGNKPIPQDIVEPEVMRLQDLSQRIGQTYWYLMTTFFQDNTWDVRQGIGYDMPILDAASDGKDRNRKKERDMEKRILADLGERIEYIEAAYHFPDVLSGMGFGTGPAWFKIMTEHSGEPKAKVAQSIISEMEASIALETQNFSDFLKSDIFKQAFSIKVDRKTGKYTISDLILDPDQMMSRWNELLVLPNKQKNKVDLSSIDV